MKTRMSIALLALVAVFAIGSARAEGEAPALKCPVSKQPAKAEQKASYNGGEVEFCCPNCLAAFEKDPSKFAAQANLQLTQTKQLKQVKCPLTGRPMAPGKSVEVEGLEVGLCCAGCQSKASKLEGEDLINLLFKDTTKGFEAAKK